MMGDTAIQWTDKSWNPATGCTKVSAGCDNCYAERLTERWKGRGSFAEVIVHHDRLGHPFLWKQPQRVFVNSMSDLFHAEIPRNFIAQVFAVMALTPRHTYQVLTKRPGRMHHLLSGRSVLEGGGFAEEVAEEMDRIGRARGWDEWPAPQWPLPNVWLGVSVEDQHAADARIPELLKTPALIRFLSCEPLLGSVTLIPEHIGGYPESDQWTRDRDAGHVPLLDWVIIGGESGALNAVRPMDLQWVRDLIHECWAADIACFVKQLGRHPTEGPFGRLKLRDSHGGNPDEWPDGLHVREFPSPEPVRT